jgi:hypothetical protein
MDEKLKTLNEELESFIQVLLFFNLNFHKLQSMNKENNSLYYYHLSRRYSQFIFEREKILKN